MTPRARRGAATRRGGSGAGAALARALARTELADEAREWGLVARGRSQGAGAGIRRLSAGLRGADGGAAATVCLTGTGTPLPVPGRAGPGTLIAVDGLHVQVDAGRGTVLRLAEVGVRCRDVDAVLVTHHHSDHLMDLADLLLTRWVQGAPSPLAVVVPNGPARAFVESLTRIWEADIDVRRRHGSRPAGPGLAVHGFDATGRAAVVWSGGPVTARAVSVRHEPVVPAVAYRVEGAGASVVVSGDTRACDEVESLAAGADILVHEAMRRDAVEAAGMPHVAAYHADAGDVGALAARAGAGTLVLTHLEPSPRTRADVLAFRRAARRGGFQGRLLVGRDRMVVRAAAGAAPGSAAEGRA